MTDQHRAVVLGLVDGLGQNRDVVDFLVGLEAATCSHDHFGPTVHYPISQLFCSKSSENDGMDGSDPSTSPRSEQSLGNHRQVDDYAVALDHSLTFEEGSHLAGFLVGLTQSPLPSLVDHV